MPHRSRQLLLDFAAKHFGIFREMAFLQTRYCDLLNVEDEAQNVWVLKVMMPSTTIDGDNHSLAAGYNNTSSFFRSGLAHLGVPLSRVYLYEIFRGSAIQLSSHEGTDCDRILRANPEALPMLLPRLIKAISGVLYQPDPQIGIDPLLTNFCTGDNLHPVYVDTFPPLCLHEGEYLVHHPNPTDPRRVQIEISRKFRPTGVLRRLRFALIAIKPQWVRQFDQSLDHLDEPVQSNAREFFRSIPNGELVGQSAEQIMGYLRNLPEDDVDCRREVAALTIPVSNPNRDQLLQEIFVLTSAVPLPQFDSREKRLERFHEVIADQLALARV